MKTVDEVVIEIQEYLKTKTVEKENNEYLPYGITISDIIINLTEFEHILRLHKQCLPKDKIQCSTIDVTKHFEIRLY